MTKYTSSYLPSQRSGPPAPKKKKLTPSEARKKRGKTYSKQIKTAKDKLKSFQSKRKWYGGGKTSRGFGNFGVTDKTLKRAAENVRDAERNKKTDGGRTDPIFKKKN